MDNISQRSINNSPAARRKAQLIAEADANDTLPKPEVVLTASQRFDHSIRTAALDRAITSMVGMQTSDGKVTYNADLILQGAKKFEEYLRTGNVPDNAPKLNLKIETKDQW